MDSGDIILTLSVAIKNCTAQRYYIIKEWPGNTALRNSLLMDPFLAILSWWFCNVSPTRGGGLITPGKLLTPQKFKAFFRERQRSCGVASGDTPMYSGHSLKRVAVQLYHSLGVRDE